MFQQKMLSGGLGKVVKNCKTPTSPCYTVPQTLEPEDFTYYTDFSFDPSVEVVAVSLNGMLWCIKFIDEEGDAVYYLVAFAFDPITKKLFWADTRPLDWLDGIPEYPVMRGIDWILTCHVMYQWSPDAPYILKRQIKALIDIPESLGWTLRYSILRGRGRVAPVHGQSVGPGRDPFTHQWMSTSRISTALGHLSLYPLGTRQVEQCYSTLLDIGGWQIIEDFIVPKPSAGYVPPTTYHSLSPCAKPLIPLELNWYIESGKDMATYPTFGVGYGADRRGVMVATFDECLYARGLMYMGRAYLLPATINQNGVPEEYYLLITNSDRCTGPYNQFDDPFLDIEDPWLDVGAVGLKDVREVRDQVAGFMTQKSEDPMRAPICLVPETGEILMPNDPNPANRYGYWVSPRPGDEGGSTYDPFSRLGLFLGGTGAAIFGVDSSTGLLAPTPNYDCATLSDWLAPARKVEAISKDVVVSSVDGRAIVTMPEAYFQRFTLPDLFLPLTWGFTEVFDEKGTTVTEELRFSMGLKDVVIEGDNGLPEETKLVTVTEFVAPLGTHSPIKSIPPENVHRNPFKFRTLLAEDGTAFARDYHIHSPLNVSGALTFTKKVWSDSTKQTAEFAFLNPDTGAVTAGQHTFPDRVRGTLNVQYAFPVTDGDGVIGARSESGVFMPLPLSVLPHWLKQPDDWRYIELLSAAALRGEGKTKLPAMWMSSIFLFQPSLLVQDNYRGPYPGEPDPAGIEMQELSSQISINWLNDSVGKRVSQIVNNQIKLTVSGLAGDYNGDWYNYTGEFEVKHYGFNPVPRFDGKIKYLSTIAVMQTRNGVRIPPRNSNYNIGSWTADRLYAFRLDLDPNIFDFDEELKRCNHFANLD